MFRSKLLTACWMLFVVGVAGAVTWASMRIQDQDDDELAKRRDLMRTKLMYSQNIVEGLAVKNFNLVRDGATEIDAVMRAIVVGPGDNPEYKRMSAELRMATDNLVRAADSGNLEATALRYFELTLRCIDCHEFLRKFDF
ncbi:MAG TPA: hypothetical protein PKD54_10850 [Pirellulaceae bacterium]|nr:hypothetical protein [Pirellulaceae bacterium]